MTEYVLKKKPHLTEKHESRHFQQLSVDTTISSGCSIINQLTLILGINVVFVLTQHHTRLFLYRILIISDKELITFIITTIFTPKNPPLQQGADSVHEAGSSSGPDPAAVTCEMLNLHSSVLFISFFLVLLRLPAAEAVPVPLEDEPLYLNDTRE